MPPRKPCICFSLAVKFRLDNDFDSTDRLNAPTYFARNLSLRFSTFIDEEGDYF